MTEIRQVFAIGDKQFASKAEAMDYLRRPKIEAALSVVTEKNADLTTWLLDNQETVEMAFEQGTIRRVSKSERNKLAKSLEALKALPADPKLAFLVEHADTVLSSFRWPSVQRMTDEEKAVAAKNTLMGATENNEKLADWILANKEAILQAYEAGVEKRVLNPKAAEGLAAWRAEKNRQKAEAAAKAEAEAAAANG